MSDFVVSGDNGARAIVGTPTPAKIIVGGTLIGPQGVEGPQGNTGPTGATGATGPQGATGGIVPITVSNTAPSSPNVNDLWIDIS